MKVKFFNGNLHIFCVVFSPSEVNENVFLKMICHELCRGFDYSYASRHVCHDFGVKAVAFLPAQMLSLIEEILRLSAIALPILLL